MKQQLLLLALLALSNAFISAQNCTNFNLPAPLGDSCHQAPLLCGNYLEGYCSSTAGLTPDQPGFATNQIPNFEKNGWLRITTCEDSIAIDFQVFDCQTGSELGFFLLSGDCDTMTLLSSTSAQDGSVAQLTAGGLTPGEIYFLAVEGFNNADCKFQAHVAFGIGTAIPGPVTCDCTNNAVVGPVDICPGDIVQYNFVAGSCTMSVGSPTGGNGYFCCPDTCPAGKDSLVLHWIVPSWMTIVGDSINVSSISVQVDSSLLGIDTVLTGTVSYFWEIIHLTPSDSSFYCACCQGCTPGDSPLDVIMHHDVETIYCELNCVQPCCSYNSQTFCSPGIYIVEQTNCLTKKMVVTADWALPLAYAGQGGVLTCVNPSVTLGGNSSIGPNYTYFWSGPGITPFGQHQPTITVSSPGAYTLLVTNTANGCTNSHSTVVTADFNIPTVLIPPVPKVCLYETVTLTAIGNPSFAQYTWSNNMIGQQITFDALSPAAYTVTVTNLFNGCTNTAVATVQVLYPIIMNLPPRTICEGECMYIAGDEFCPTGSGFYSFVATSYQGCDSTISLLINVTPTVVINHGTVGTLTCDVTSISFMGNVYNQPGNYTVPGANGCGEHQFVIDLDISPPNMDLGQPQDICAGQTATLAVSPILPNVEYIWSNNTVGTQIEVSPTATATYTVTAHNLLTGCVSSDQVTVNVNPAVDTDFGVIGTLTCNQLEINFLGKTYNQPGQYTEPIPGGCGNHIFQILGDLTPPWCPVLPVPAVCAGETVILQTAPPSPSSLNYLWSTGDTTQEVAVTPLATTPYTVTATDPITGCMSTVTIIVVVNQPQLVPLGLVGTLTCTQTCLTYNGVEYCQPGTYSVTENCEIKEFQIGQDLTLPTLQLGVVGTLTCAQPCLSFNGVEYCQPGTYSVTENCEIKEFQIGQDLVLSTLQLGVVGTLTCTQPCLSFNGVEYCQPGTYSVTENCEIKEFQIGEDLTLPTLQLGVVGTLTCTQPCLSFNGVEYCQPGTFSVTENCEIKEFQIGQDLTLPTLQLGVVGTLTCAQPCLTFNGVEYCQPGSFSVIENCEIKEFQIGQDLDLPTLQLGMVGTLTCAQPCLTFNGVEYCQPGSYTVTENCEIKEFQIGQDLTLPTVQLGLAGNLTCEQPCLTFNGVEYCQPGTYSVTENCEIKEFQIGELPPVWLELGEDQTIVAGESVELEAQTNAQPAVISWHNSTGVMTLDTSLGVMVQPGENTLYTIEIKDLNGCLVKDSIWILVEEINGQWFAPSVIRPLSEGSNGWFTLFASPNHVAEIQMLEIYDRWGNLVFTRKNFPPNVSESGWDGTQNGKTYFNPAVFVWQATLLLKNGSAVRVDGDVTVVR